MASPAPGAAPALVLAKAPRPAGPSACLAWLLASILQAPCVRAWASILLRGSFLHGDLGHPLPLVVALWSHLLCSDTVSSRDSCTECSPLLRSPGSIYLPLAHTPTRVPWTPPRAAAEPPCGRWHVRSSPSTQPQDRVWRPQSDPSVPSCLPRVHALSGSSSQVSESSVTAPPLGLLKGRPLLHRPSALRRLRAR